MRDLSVEEVTLISGGKKNPNVIYASKTTIVKDVIGLARSIATSSIPSGIWHAVKLSYDLAPTYVVR